MEVATCTSRFTFSSCRWPREFATAPRSRFASGNSVETRRSCTFLVARARRHVQRARIWSGAAAFPSPIARRRMRTPAARSFSHGGACVTSVTRSSKSARSTGVATRSSSAVIRSRRFGFSAAQVERNVSSAPLLARPSVNLRAKSARWSKRIWRPAIVAQKRCSSSSRYFGSIRCHSRWMTARRRATSGRHGDEPRDRRQLAARAALLAAARRGRDARSLAVEVGAEEPVQRDDAVVVRRGLRA